MRSFLLIVAVMAAIAGCSSSMSASSKGIGQSHEPKALEPAGDLSDAAVSGEDGVGASVETAEGLAQHGIRWGFESPVEYGQYVNGDYWVVGPVTITDIDPPSVSSSARHRNGSMINPSPTTSRNGYDSDIRDNSYDPGLNVALDVSTSSPLTVAPASSLVSTISVEQADARPGIDTAAVLTVVDEPPAPNSFRPPYSGTDKTSRFTSDQLRTELLPRLDAVAGTPDPKTLANRFERVWLDHRPGWSGRSLHPATSMPDYGRDLTARLGEGYLTLMLDLPADDKHDLLINLVQIGIDFHGIVEDGGEQNWMPNGGHAQGRKLPILFAGHLLNDPTMAAIGQRDDVSFGEDAQTFYITQADVDRGNGYTTNDIGIPEWGIRHATDPSRDDASWGASYRQCCTANSWHSHVLTARIMDLQPAWNHDPLFDYTDRFMARQPTGSHNRSWNRPFSENMWDTHN